MCSHRTPPRVPLTRHAAGRQHLGDAGEGMCFYEAGTCSAPGGPQPAGAVAAGTARQSRRRCHRAPAPGLDGGRVGGTSPNGLEQRGRWLLPGRGEARRPAGAAGQEALAHGGSDGAGRARVEGGWRRGGFSCVFLLRLATRHAQDRAQTRS